VVALQNRLYLEPELGLNSNPTQVGSEVKSSLMHPSRLKSHKEDEHTDKNGDARDIIVRDEDAGSHLLRGQVGREILMNNRRN